MSRLIVPVAGDLPATGAPLMALALIGLECVLLGATLVLAGRLRTRSVPEDADAAAEAQTPP